MADSEYELATEDCLPEDSVREIVRETDLKKLCLIPTEPCDGLLSALDHTPTIREALRGFTEFEIETSPDNNGISKTERRDCAELALAIDEAEKEIMMVKAKNFEIDSDEKNRGFFYEPAESHVDLFEITARQFNLIRFDDVKMSYKNILSERPVALKTQKCPLRNMTYIGPHNWEKIPAKKKPTFMTNTLKETKRDPHRAGIKLRRAPRKKVDECKLKHMRGFDDLGLTPLHNKWDDPIGNTFISWKPERVEFQNYKIGKTYKKRVTIKNVTPRSIKFGIRLDKGAHQMFDLIFAKAMVGYFTLAPGMKMSFAVKFKCADLDDYETFVSVDEIENLSARIEVVAKRKPPTLISEEFFFPTTTGRANFKNSTAITIDCDTNFLGAVTQIKTSLFNMGSEAKFFITSEGAWKNHDTPVILDDSKIGRWPPFELKPVSFFLKTGHNVEMTVTFNPVCEGLHTEKLMILCDNYTIRSIDLLGDAILFDPTQYCLNAHAKEFDVDEIDYYNSIQCVDFGFVKRNSISVQEIRIKSDCPVNTDYHWGMRKLPDWPVDRIIKRVNLNTFPCYGTLCAMSTEDVEITCNTKDMSPGVYKGLLCLVGEKIPKISLKTDTMPGQMYQTEDTVNVEIMFLELRICVGEVNIEIDPPVVYFEKERKTAEEFRIEARNLCPWDAHVEWALPENIHVSYKISPNTAIIAANESVNFILTVNAEELGYVNDFIRLECTSEDACFKFMVVGKVLQTSAPLNKYLCHDLGPVMAGTEIDTEFRIDFEKSMEDFSLDIAEIEGVFDLPSATENSAEYQLLGTKSFPNTELGFFPKIPDTILYNSIAEKVEGTELRLTITKMESAGHEFYEDTVTLVQKADVFLDSATVNLTSEFYKCVPIRFKVDLVNRNQLCLDYKWEPPTGDDSKFAVVKYDPEAGRLNRLERQEIEIELTVARPGPLNDLVLPCVIERNCVILQLKCNGVVEDINVEITYPNKNQYISFKWPKLATDIRCVSEDLDIKDEKCCVCFISKFSENVPLSWAELCEQRILQFTDSMLSLPPYENWPSVGGMYYSEKFRDNALKRDFFHGWEPEDIRRRMIRITPEEKSQVIKFFGEHALVFYINTYQPGKQSIKIENLTPIETSYEVEMQEFAECQMTTTFRNENCGDGDKEGQCYPTEFSKSVLNDLCDKIQPKSGLVISLVNSHGSLGLRETVSIDVIAFASCWGVYFDHIVIRVGGLTPAIIPVLVVVNGPPVWFTMAPPMNSVAAKDPSIRFYDVLRKSNASQKLYVHNDTFLPLKLSWTTYARKPLPQKQLHLNFADEAPDLSINLELHPTEAKENNFCSVHLTDGYGVIDSTYFNVNPRVMYLEPHQTLPLTVELRTSRLSFDVDHMINILRGAAHAYIYVNDDVEGNDPMNYCSRVDGGFSVYRPDGPNLDPLVLRMETKLAVFPLTCLNDEADDFIFKVSASEMVRSKSKIYEEKRVYRFQNAGDTTQEVTFDTIGFLHLIGASVNDDTRVNKGQGIRVILTAGSVIQVYVKLTLAEGDLQALVKTNSENDLTDVDKNKQPSDAIIITHKSIMDQVIPVRITVCKTTLELSASFLDFGEVLLGDTKIMSVRLRCVSGAGDFKCSVISGFKNVFVVSPHSGSLSSSEYIHLNVAFTPKECLDYSSMLRVAGESRKLYAQLTGMGSWDYKNHVRLPP